MTSTSPDNSIYRPTYNEANLLDKVDVYLQGAATATNFVTNINYNAKGQRETISYANGSQTNYEYDPLTYRLMQQQTTRPTNPDITASQLFNDISIVQNLFHTYDPVGNLTRIEDRALKTVFNNGQQVKPESNYTYDAIYRLIETHSREHISQTIHDFNPPNGYRDFPYTGNRANPNDLQALRNYIQQYEYDVVGNFETQRHNASGGNWTRRYDYEEQSQIEQSQNNNRLTRTTVGNGTNYIGNNRHDVHGNITQMAHLPNMVWDFEDQLHQVELSVGTAFYVYDTNGQRVRKVIETQNGTREKERLYLGGFEIYREFAANGTTVTLERESLHIMDDQNRIALVDTRKKGNEQGIPVQLIRYQVTNHLGSSSLELDNVGALISYEEYHPFGTTAFQAGRSVAEVNQKRYRYTGKERDEETGFSYHGARYYAPWLARWTSCDPALLELKGFSRALFQSYEYVENRPVVANDPNGKFLNLITAAIGTVVGAVVGGAIEAGRQYITTGKVSDWKAIGASAAGGAVSGAVAGLTLGASLVAQAAVATASGVAGGATTRALTGQEQTAGAVFQDAAIGLVTFGIVKGGSATISKLRSGSGAAATTGTRTATTSVAKVGSKASSSVDDVGAYPATLSERLSAYKQWKQRAEIDGSPSYAQFRRFQGAHRPNSRSKTLYNNPSEFAAWSKPLDSVHGNIAGNQPAWLYRLETGDGEFLKWGISQNPATRYSSSFMEDKILHRIQVAPRKEILKIERNLVETQPGPLNKEQWRGIRLGE
ncbi:MAG: RHS repeat domain-containing protein [Gammaproteobacteria bacterium]